MGGSHLELRLGGGHLMGARVDWGQQRGGLGPAHAADLSELMEGADRRFLIAQGFVGEAKRLVRILTLRGEIERLT